MSNDETRTGAVPTSIGPYRVDRELGRGGMGVVYQAHDPKLDRPVAIKCLHADRSSDPEHIERLRREALVMATLSHPHAATIYGFETYDDQHCLILELVPGRSLADRLRDGPLRIRKTLKLGAQIAGARAAAHERGVVHRDLKPSNILITPDGDAKVLDFGIAETAETDDEGAPTRGGALVGTVRYMSPEQAEGREVDARSDVWSLGCVLWECLCGRPPFRGKTQWETLDLIVRKAPDWDELPEDLSPLFARLLQRCLEKEPTDRLRDLRDARLEMTAIRDSTADPATGPWIPPTAMSARPNALRSRLALIGAFAGGIVAALATGWIDLPRTDSSAEVLRLESDLSTEGAGGFDFAISPDGREIVYQDRVENHGALHRRTLTDWESVELAETRSGRLPFFSPDGDWIGFFPRDSTSGKARALTKLALTSSSPTVLADDLPVGVGASWSDDGRVIFTPSWQSGLWSVDENGGEPIELTRPDLDRNEVSHRWPHVLPGSGAVLYTVKTSSIRSFDEARIDLLDLRTGESKILVEGGTAPAYLPSSSNAGFLLWSRDHALHAAPFNAKRLEIAGPAKQVVDDLQTNRLTGQARFDVSDNGTLVYFSSVPPRKNRIVGISKDGRVEALTQEARHHGMLRVSPDGNRLLVKVIEANNSLWMLNRKRGTFTRIDQGVGNIDSPIWSPDGEHIAYVTEIGGVQEILRGPIDGTSPAKVLIRGTAFELCDWSPQNEIIYLQTISDNDRDLWALPFEKTASGDAKPGMPRPLLRTQADECGRLSPDGSLLAITARTPERTELFLHPFPGPGARLQVSVDGARGKPIWSADGRELYFSHSGDLHVVRIETEPELSLGEVRKFLHLADLQIHDFDGDSFLGTAATAKRETAATRMKVVVGWSHELQTFFSE